MGEQDHKVAIITGGSQGIVAVYRRRDWAVVATSRTIKPTWDPAVLAVDGDVSGPRWAPPERGVAGYPAGGVETSASFTRVSSYGGYSANLPLEDLTDHKAWIAYRYDG